MTDYDISKYGFLPSYCVRSLPSNFSFMKVVLDNLAEDPNDELRIRTVIKSLEKYDEKKHSLDNLSTEQVKFMYSFLTMAVQRYVWCNGPGDARNYDVIPEIIGVPLLKASKILGIVPVLTHAAVDLYNWHLIDETAPFSLDNIDVNYSMTGNESEAWFYKVMIAIEGVSGPFLNKIHREDINEELMVEFINVLKDITKIIKRMYEKCDQEFFFNKLRIYLSGSENENLPNGLKIEGTSTILKYKGGSAAQSSLIQVFNALLGIENEEKTKIFLNEMRNYMPEIHRIFIEKIESRYSIRHVVEKKPELTPLYNEAVDQFARFRNAHLGLVRSYIMHFIPKRSDNNAHGAKGTGGTNPEEFCSQVIRDTEKSIIEPPKEDYSFWLVFSIFVTFISYLIARWWWWRI